MKAKTKKREKKYRPRLHGHCPIARAILRSEVEQTIAQLRTDMGLQAFIGRDEARIAGSAGRLFFIIAHAAGAAGYGDSPEGRVIAGACGALGDIAEMPSMLEGQRGAIISGLAAVDRLLPLVTVEQLADGACAFDYLLRSTSGLRTVDVQTALFGGLAHG